MVNKLTDEIVKLRELEETLAGQPRIHKKTGNLYSVEGVALVQASEDTFEDMGYAVVYFNEDGDMFVRPIGEFNKRFRELNDDDVEELNSQYGSIVE